MTPFPSKKYVEMPEIVYGLNLGEWSESVFGVENMERGYRTTQTLQCNSCKNKTKVQYSCYCKAITTVREPNFLSSFLAWYHHAFIFSYSTTTCCWSGFSRHLPRPPNPSRGNRPNPSFGSTAWCSARPRKRINKSCKKGWRNKKKLRNCIARRFYHVTCMTRFYDWSSMNRTSDWPWWAVLLVNKNWSQQAQNLGLIWIMPNDETNPEIFSCSAHVLNGPKPVELSRCVVFGILSDRITFFSSPCAGRLKHLWRQPGFPKNKANWYTLQTSNPSEILATRVTKQATLTWDVGQQWLVNLQKYWPKISCTICFPVQKGDIIHISAGGGFLLTTVYQGGIIILQLAGACYSTVFGKDNLFICRKKALVASDSPQDQKHHPCKLNSTCREAPFLRAKILGDAKKTNLLGPWSTWSSLPLQGTQAPPLSPSHHLSPVQAPGLRLRGFWKAWALGALGVLLCCMLVIGFGDWDAHMMCMIHYRMVGWVLDLSEMGIPVDYTMTVTLWRLIV